MDDATLLPALTRIAEALERLAPPPPEPPRPEGRTPSCGTRRRAAAEAGAARVARAVGSAAGIDRQRDLLLENTLRFARGLPANNAMLWGARGMGKSSW
jgi:predicted AAA+ superfamily ATPase